MKQKIITGLILLKVVTDRQRGYISYLSTILIGGLYSQRLKTIIVALITDFWFIIVPVWIGFIIFDIKIVLPNEQTYYHRKSKVLTAIYESNQRHIFNQASQDSYQR